MKKWYHYTTKEGLDKILCSKEINCPMGNYVCPTEEDVFKFLAVQLHNKLMDISDARLIIFTTDTPLEVSTDHNREFINADAFVSFEPIKIKNIIDVIEWNK
nr:MAG TPA: ADP-ribosyltransferase [Caudoviricetes sp.]